MSTGDAWIPPEVWDAAVVPEPPDTRVVPVAVVFCGMCPRAAIVIRVRNARDGRAFAMASEHMRDQQVDTAADLFSRMLELGDILARVERSG